MKISYINSVCVRNDAISAAIRDEISYLQEDGQRDLRLFAYECQYPDMPFSQCYSEQGLALNRHFATSDLVVFHFGVYYPLFNLLSLVPKACRKLVVFHNITPPTLLPPHSRTLIERSFAQLDNVRWADHIVCVSSTNQKVLWERGIEVPSTVVPLSVPNMLPPPSEKPSFSDETIRIVFVGRFVRSKGPTELLAAVSRLAAQCQGLSVQIDMIGNLAFSDPALVEEVRAQAATITADHSNSAVRVQIHGSAPDEVKHSILRDADIFALPTYHEGFCVPILEAFASGCRIVSYDNSNIPDVAGGCGTLVRTGDVGALARALIADVDLVRSKAWKAGGEASRYRQFIARTRRHLSRFTRDNVRRDFLRVIDGLMQR